MQSTSKKPPLAHKIRWDGWAFYRHDQIRVGTRSATNFLGSVRSEFDGVSNRRATARPDSEYKELQKSVARHLELSDTVSSPPGYSRTIEPKKHTLVKSREQSRELGSGTKLPRLGG